MDTSTYKPPKWIFLDIDGVLNDHSKMENGFCGIQAGPVRQLNRILRAVPDARIVLSSAWRYPFCNGDMNVAGLEYLLQCHGVCCYNRVQGATVRDDVIVGYGRSHNWLRKHGAEIRMAQITRWLVGTLEPDGSGSLEGFVVIDDIDLSERFPKHMVLTNGKKGLRKADADKAIAILRGEPVALVEGDDPTDADMLPPWQRLLTACDNLVGFWDDEEGQEESGPASELRAALVEAHNAESRRQEIPAYPQFHTAISDAMDPDRGNLPYFEIIERAARAAGDLVDAVRIEDYDAGFAAGLAARPDVHAAVGGWRAEENEDHFAGLRAVVIADDGTALAWTPTLAMANQIAREHNATPCGDSAKVSPCPTCGQVPNMQGGEYPCPDCGLPTLHDEPTRASALDNPTYTKADVDGLVEAVMAYTAPPPRTTEDLMATRKAMHAALTPFRKAGVFHGSPRKGGA